MIDEIDAIDDIDRFVERKSKRNCKGGEEKEKRGDGKKDKKEEKEMHPHPIPPSNRNGMEYKTSLEL